MSETPTRCPSTATVEPGGALVRCTLDAGHDVDELVGLGEHIPGGGRAHGEWLGTKRVFYGTLHEYVLTWGNPEGVDIDADIYDPDEAFDLEVDIDPVVESLRVPPVPSELCGAGGCVYVNGHGRHSWER